MPRLLNGFIPDLPPASIRFAIDGFGPFSTLSFLSFTALFPQCPITLRAVIRTGVDFACLLRFLVPPT